MDMKFIPNYRLISRMKKVLDFASRTHTHTHTYMYNIEAPQSNTFYLAIVVITPAFNSAIFEILFEEEREEKYKAVDNNWRTLTHKKMHDTWNDIKCIQTTTARYIQNIGHINGFDDYTYIG